MERDDIIEYSLGAEHSEEKGVELRKEIFKITGILSLLTLIEVGMGVWGAKNGMGWEMIKIGFIVLTLIKAGMIIMSFMHLGEERKGFKYVLLVPYTSFILYLVFIVFNEAWLAGDGRLMYLW
ncbi:MAG: cytochrome C oxidase subunit IV family protein [Flavobacteriales bacterium]|nr:cytochrome C oxidase subunit IV family protein [Flavobacteriales bacterium]